MIFDDALQRERLAKNICSELNNFTDIQPTLIYVITKIKEISSCKAVGIRLEDNGDYPYYAYEGFPKKFVKKENSICKINDQGFRIKSPDGEKYILECICGNVIEGRYDTSYDFFTDGGSFWSNNIPVFLSYIADINPDENIINNVRIRCNLCKYKSLALIPIKVRGENIGLIQINDFREDMFTLEMIEFLEMIGENIGLAVQNSQMFSKVLENSKLRETIAKQSIAIKEAEELERLRNEFFANLSHELRTPLNIMNCSLKLLNLYKDNGSLIENSDKVSKQFRTLSQNSFRMLRLINNLIDLTKIDSGFLQLNLEICNIVNLIEEISLSVVEYAKMKDVKIIFDTDIEEKMMKCDIIKIEKIILNLLSNAIKFNKTDGKIWINIFDRGNEITVSIKNTGIGIHKDKLNLIFERFRQVDKTFTRQNEGSGIGLSIVKALVEMHNGSIKVDSVYGEYCEFTVIFPIDILDDNIMEQEEKYDVKDKIIEKVKVELSDIYLDSIV